ncbi:MAG: hypothetical protein ACLFP8_03665 [Alphaproteobacteria bacterium]
MSLREGNADEAIQKATWTDILKCHPSPPVAKMQRFQKMLRKEHKIALTPESSGGVMGAFSLRRGTFFNFNPVWV